MSDLKMPEGWTKFDKLYAKDGELSRNASELLKEMYEDLKSMEAYMKNAKDRDFFSVARKKFEEWK